MADQLMRCATCRERAVEPTTLPTYRTTLEHDGRSYAIELQDFDVLQCRSCKATVLDEAAGERLDEALRQAAGLLAPGEIREGRERLGYEQNELANLLRISASTLSRWENGGQIQQRCLDAFLRVFFESPEARAILGAPRSLAGVQGTG